MSAESPVTEFLIRKKIFTLFSSQFQIFNPEGELIGFSKQKAFRLKEDIRIYTDDTMSDERLFIKARSIVDFSSAYDVIDSQTEEKLGALRRKGMSSLFRDSWEILDVRDVPIGRIREDSAGMALVRRFLLSLIPQTFHADIEGEQVATYRQRFNPFVYKLDVSIEEHDGENVDTRLLLAGGILLAAIEGRQK